MKILDIRGTHGSGKSHAVRLLLKKYNWGNSITNSDGDHIGYYLPDIDCGVIARYWESGGGCDGVKTADEVVRRVRLFAESYSVVVLEGILVAHTYQRYADLADELGRENYVFMFLDTPLAKCISRVEKRRAERGNDKPFNPRNVLKDFDRIHVRLKRQAIEAGYTVRTLNHKQPLAGILKEINGD